MAYLIVEELKKQVILPEKLFSVKLSCGSDTLPQDNVDYYTRLVSILKKCVENPMGIKKLMSLYKRAKRNKVRPPSMHSATYYSTKVMVGALLKNEYVNKNNKGYYTSKKGKILLQSKI